MRTGYSQELSSGCAVSVRRCWGGDEQVVELAVEAVEGGWFMSCIVLTPIQAALLSRDLLAEAMMPLGKEDNCVA